MASSIHRSDSAPLPPPAAPRHTAKRRTKSQNATYATPETPETSTASAAPSAAPSHTPRRAAAPRLVLREHIPAEPQFNSPEQLATRQRAIAALHAGARQSIEFLVDHARLQTSTDREAVAFRRSLEATIYGFLASRPDARNVLRTIQHACAAFDQAPHINVPIDLLQAGAGMHARTWVMRLNDMQPERRTHHLQTFLRAAEHQLCQDADATVQEVALWSTKRLMREPERLTRAQYQEVLGSKLTLLTALGRQAELVQALQDQYTLNPDAADAAAVLAHQFERMGNTAQAETWLNTALSKWHADAHCLVLQTTVAKDLQAAGIPLLERALDTLAQIACRSPLRPEECAQTLTMLAAAHPLRARSRALLQEAQGYAPLNPQDALCLSRLLLQPLPTPELLQAQAVLRATLDRHPESVPVRRELLKVAKMLGDRQAMSVIYRSLVHREPDNLGQLRAAAEHFASHHAYSDAANMLVLARKLEPQDVALCIDVARYGHAANKPKLRSEISAALRIALQLQPEHPEALLLLGHMRNEAKQYAAAQALYERAAAAAGSADDKAKAQQSACAALSAQLAPLVRHKKLSGPLLARHAELQARRDSGEPGETGDLLEGLRALLAAARHAAQVPEPTPEIEPVLAAQPVLQIATSDPLQTADGKIIGVNYADEAVLQRPDGSMAWSPNGSHADRWLRHAPDPLVNVPVAQRHTLPSAVRAELDALLTLPVVGTRTLGDFVTALAGHAPGSAAAPGERSELCVLRGSRVHHVLLKHFAQQDNATPQSRARLQYLAHRAQSGAVSDIDLGTSRPPTQAYDRCSALAPDSMGACGAGGVASPMFNQYHGMNTYHDHAGAALHLDVASFCTAGSLAARQALDGAHTKVYPKVFGTCLKAWAQVQAFAPLFYNFHTGEILDPTGTAWDDLQQGVLRIASEAGHANPMLALLAAKQAPLQLSIPAADLRIIRQQAARQLATDPAFTARLVARAAPAGLGSASALLEWVRGPLRGHLQAMQLGHVYKTCLAPCSMARLAEAYRRRAPAGTFSVPSSSTLPETLDAACAQEATALGAA